VHGIGNAENAGQENAGLEKKSYSFRPRHPTDLSFLGDFCWGMHCFPAIHARTSSKPSCATVQVTAIYFKHTRQAAPTIGSTICTGTLHQCTFSSLVISSNGGDARVWQTTRRQREKPSADTSVAETRMLSAMPHYCAGLVWWSAAAWQWFTFIFYSACKHSQWLCRDDSTRNIVFFVIISSFHELMQSCGVRLSVCKHFAQIASSTRSQTIPQNYINVRSSHAACSSIINLVSFMYIVYLFFVFFLLFCMLYVLTAFTDHVRLLHVFLIKVESWKWLDCD